MTENTHPVDRRARRSVQALWDALVALLQRHDWAEITVQMITDQADVARSTFYAHFQTKQDLLDAGFHLVGGALRQQVLAGKPAENEGFATLDWLVEHTATSRDFLRRVCASPAGQIIQGRFRAVVTAILADELASIGAKVSPREMTFLTGGIFAVIDDWLAQGCPESQDSLALKLSQRLRGQILA